MDSMAEPKNEQGDIQIGIKSIFVAISNYQTAGAPRSVKEIL